MTFQWRIPDFPDGRAPTSKAGANLLFGQLFAENYMEMKEFGSRVGRVPGTTLDSPMLLHCPCADPGLLHQNQRVGRLDFGFLRCATVPADFDFKWVVATHIQRLRKANVFVHADWCNLLQPSSQNRLLPESAKFSVTRRAALLENPGDFVRSSHCFSGIPTE